MNIEWQIENLNVILWSSWKAVVQSIFFTCNKAIEYSQRAIKSEYFSNLMHLTIWIIDSETLCYINGMNAISFGNAVFKFIDHIWNVCTQSQCQIFHSMEWFNSIRFCTWANDSKNRCHHFYLKDLHILHWQILIPWNFFFSIYFRWAIKLLDQKSYLKMINNQKKKYIASTLITISS